MLGILIPIIAVLDDHRAAGIVEDPDVPIAAGDRCQLAAIIIVIIGNRAIRPACSKTITIISIRPSHTTACHRGKLSAMLPGECSGSVQYAETAVLPHPGSHGSRGISKKLVNVQIVFYHDDYCNNYHRYTIQRNSNKSLSPK